MDLAIPSLHEATSDRKPRYRPCLAITHGDPNGIGPEVVLKALADRRVRQFMDPVLVGSAHVWRRYANQLQLASLKLEVIAEPGVGLGEGLMGIIDILPRKKAKLALGQGTREGGRLSMEAVRVAADLAKEGAVDAIVTAPISKRAISLAGYKFPGHTEYLAARTGSDRAMMILVSDVLRVGLVTHHVPLGQVSALVTAGAVKRHIVRLSQSLQEDFGISRPKVAVLGLNPHAGDGGVLGREEIEQITPAIKAACKEEWLAFGPFPADGFFGAGRYRQYDAVLAMYHDQGLTPFKALAFGVGVNFTAGLPIIRTSVDHGTAFDIAGQGIASPKSMLHAIWLAVDIVGQHRLNDQVA